MYGGSPGSRRVCCHLQFACLDLAHAFYTSKWTGAAYSLVLFCQISENHHVSGLIGKNEV